MNNEEALIMFRVIIIYIKLIKLLRLKFILTLCWRKVFREKKELQSTKNDKRFI